MIVLKTVSNIYLLRVVDIGHSGFLPKCFLENALQILAGVRSHAHKHCILQPKVQFQTILQRLAPRKRQS